MSILTVDSAAFPVREVACVRGLSGGVGVFNAQNKMLGWQPVDGKEDLIEKTRDALIVDCVDLSRAFAVVEPYRWQQRVAQGGLTASIAESLASPPKGMKKDKPGRGRLSQSRSQVWALMGSDLVDLNVLQGVKRLSERILLMGAHPRDALLSFELKDFEGDDSVSETELQEAMQVFSRGLSQLISLHQQGIDLKEEQALLDDLSTQLL